MTMAKRRASLRDHYVSSITSALLCGEDVGKWIGTGADKESVERIAGGILRSPIYRAAVECYPIAYKAKSFSKCLKRLHRLSKSAHVVPQFYKLPAEIFFEEFYCRNRPVLIQGMMEDAESLQFWSAGFFSEVFGKVEIEIDDNRDLNDRYERDADQHKKRVLLQDYMKLIDENPHSNNRYISARNNILGEPALQLLFSQMACPEGFLDNHQMNSEFVKMWIGPAGTVTPLHHDGTNVLFGQVVGRKRFSLVAPIETDALYNYEKVYSDVDLEKIDYSKFPLMRQVPVATVTVGPGDFLFLPLGWWHSVVSLDLSISLTHLNFVFENMVWDCLEPYEAQETV